MKVRVKFAKLLEKDKPTPASETFCSEYKLEFSGSFWHFPHISLFEGSEKVFFKTVIPVKLVPEGLDRGTGIQSFLKQFKSLDSCFRRNDTLKPGLFQRPPRVSFVQCYIYRSDYNFSSSAKAMVHPIIPRRFAVFSGSIYKDAIIGGGKNKGKSFRYEYKNNPPFNLVREKPLRISILYKDQNCDIGNEDTVGFKF